MLGSVSFRYIFGIPPLILVLLPVTSSECHIKDKEGKAYESVLMISIDELVRVVLFFLHCHLWGNLEYTFSMQFYYHISIVLADKKGGKYGIEYSDRWTIPLSLVALLCPLGIHHIRLGLGCILFQISGIHHHSLCLFPSCLSYSSWNVLYIRRQKITAYNVWKLWCEVTHGYFILMCIVAYKSRYIVFTVYSIFFSLS